MVRLCCSIFYIKIEVQRGDHFHKAIVQDKLSVLDKATVSYMDVGCRR